MPTDPARPNILWICTEHQRYDTVHALGNDHIRTPNLDRLVREGVAFTHAFGQNTVCTPSRSSFLTGRYPVTTRCRQNGQNIPDDEILMTRELRDRGYDCGLAGKLHVSSSCTGSERRINDGYRMFQWSHGSTQKHGGDWVRWLEANGQRFDDLYQRSSIPLTRHVTDRRWHQTTWCFDTALGFMQQQRSGPWQVSINPFSAHDPFDYLDEFFDGYDPDSLPLPAFRPGELDAKPRAQRLWHEGRGLWKHPPERLRQMKAAYYATIEHIDAELGRLLDWLDDTGQRENTLILFHADHGEMLGDHGLPQKGPFLYDPAVRLPLMLSWPGVLPCGQRQDAMVELVDIVPTLYELLGEGVPERVQGKSLLPLIRGEIEEHRTGVYSEYYNANRGRDRCYGYDVYATMWRTRTHKLVVHHGEPLGELYDLEHDPCEHENLWDDPAHAALRAELMKQAFDASVFTMDPMPPRVGNF